VLSVTSVAKKYQKSSFINFTTAVELLAQECKEVKFLLDFIETSERGWIR
jgi:hypothetical protein